MHRWRRCSTRPSPGVRPAQEHIHLRRPVPDQSSLLPCPTSSQNLLTRWPQETAMLRCSCAGQAALLIHSGHTLGRRVGLASGQGTLQGMWTLAPRGAGTLPGLSMPTSAQRDFQSSRSGLVPTPGGLSGGACLPQALRPRLWSWGHLPTLCWRPGHRPMPVGARGGVVGQVGPAVWPCLPELSSEEGPAPGVGSAVVCCDGGARAVLACALEPLPRLRGAQVAWDGAGVGLALPRAECHALAWTPTWLLHWSVGRRLSSLLPWLPPRVLWTQSLEKAQLCWPQCVPGSGLLVPRSPPLPF